MANLTRRALLATAGRVGGAWPLGAIAAAASTAPLRAMAAGAPRNGAVQADRGRVPNPELIAHDGRRVRFYDDLVRGRTVAVSFFYLRCKGICPRGTENLLEVQRLLGDRLGKDVFFYSLTLAPEEDGPRELAAYRTERGIGPGWTFLTGAPANVELVRRGLGFTDPDPVIDEDRSQHSGLLVYGNEPRGWWGALPVLSSPIEIASALARVAPRA